ncbi:MAG: RING finger protein [Ignavibacteria bacterium]
MICPICLKQIKTSDTSLVCELCGRIYHNKCWTKHNGCISKSCPNNPKNISNNIVNIGEMTIEQLQSFLSTAGDQGGDVLCPKCYKLNDKNSIYCKYCGQILLSKEKESTTENFEKEFLQKLEEKIRKRNRKILTFVIFIFLISIIGLTIYLALNTYINSDTYKFNTILKKWRNLYQEKNTSIVQEIFDEDYQFIDKNNKHYSISEVLKQLNNSEQSITIKIDSLKIQYDDSDSSYVNLTFSKLISLGKSKERSFHTLRLIKQNNQWKIFREYSQTTFLNMK